MDSLILIVALKLERGRCNRLTEYTVASYLIIVVLYSYSLISIDVIHM